MLDVADGPVGIALPAADSRMSSGTAVMCVLCQTGRSERVAGFRASVRR